MGLIKPKFGGTLPSLSNPAGAANIQLGYEAINGAGRKITGTHTELKTKTGIITVSEGTFSINIPDVGTDYNRISLAFFDYEHTFTYTELNTGYSIPVFLSNALITADNVVTEKACCTLEPTQTENTFKFNRQSFIPNTVFTFNADGSVTFNVQNLTWTKFAAGQYVYIAWREE